MGVSKGESLQGAVLGPLLLLGQRDRHSRTIARVSATSSLGSRNGAVGSLAWLGVDRGGARCYGCSRVADWYRDWFRSSLCHSRGLGIRGSCRKNGGRKNEDGAAHRFLRDRWVSSLQWYTLAGDPKIWDEYV